MAGGNSTSPVADATAARPGAKTPTGGVARNEDHLQRRPGTHTLFCSLPEHEQEDMKATLVVS
jgi:hypothetical protein